MTGRLAGEVAIVTGASRGLGRSIAVALAAEGASVVVAARTEAVWDERLPGTIAETVADIEAAGGRALAVRADLREHEEIAHLVDVTRSNFGPVSILVNNAAFTAPGRPPKADEAPRAPARSDASAAGPKADWPGFLGTPVSAFRRHFEIAVFAAYELMQQAAADMITKRHGAIINITSGASRMPGDGPYPAPRDQAGLPGYGGSKIALEHLTQNVAYSLQDHGVSVNALSPSRAIMTPGVAYYAQQFDEYSSTEDFAEAVVRLALVDPNSVTGRTIGHDQVLDGTFDAYVFAG
jgi:7-alpha-hydroxysteroid dehydrogenase